MSYTPDRIEFQKNLPKLVESDRQALLVAAEDEQVVGYAMASESMTLYANGPTVELIELVVKEARRGRAGEYYQKLGFEETAAFYRYKL